MGTLSTGVQMCKAILKYKMAALNTIKHMESHYSAMPLLAQFPREISHWCINEVYCGIVWDKRELERALMNQRNG